MSKFGDGKSLSSYNYQRLSFLAAIRKSLGSSGTTAQASLAYVRRSTPLIVILENVWGLFLGAKKKDIIGQELIDDLLSNLHELLGAMRGSGYAIVASKTDSAPRVDARRRRAWLPAVHAPRLTDEQRAEVELAGESVMATLSACHSFDDVGEKVVSLGDILMQPGDEDHQVWSAKIAKEMFAAHSEVDEDSGLNGLPPDRGDHTYCWHAVHKATYDGSGMQWPPILPPEFLSEMKRLRVTDREAGVIYYIDETMPMSDVLVDEIVTDISQAINRLPSSGYSQIMPCITPQGRFWLRRARRFLYGGEAMRAQGCPVVMEASTSPSSI